MLEDILEKLNETSNALLVSLFLGFFWMWVVNTLTYHPPLSSMSLEYMQMKVFVEGMSVGLMLSISLLLRSGAINKILGGCFLFLVVHTILNKMALIIYFLDVPK